MPKPSQSLLFPFALIVALSTTSPPRAAELTFNIDPAQSHLTFSLETLDGTAVSSPQSPGSDTTSLSGTMSADLTASTIQFLTTNNTQLALQAVPQAPLPGGAPGTAPAQYGLSISIPGVGGGVTAARGWVADASSDAIPLSAGAFDATQLLLNFPAGVTPYNLVLNGNSLMGSISNPGLPVFNSLSGGTLSLVGDTYTLSAPILASGTVGVGGVTLLNVFSGQLVATATVPEPSSIVLALVGTLALPPWSGDNGAAKIPNTMTQPVKKPGPATVTMVEESAATGRVREIFDDIKATKKIDFVPNMWKTLATSPPLLEQIWTRLKVTMAPGKLDPLTKEMIALAVSATNGCAYCVNSHTAAVKKLGLDDEALGELMAVVAMFNSTNALAEGYQIEPDVLP